MAQWFGWNFTVIIASWFVIGWNLKLQQAIVASFQTLVPSFTIWDLWLPFYLFFFFTTFWLWLRPSVNRRPYA